MKRDMDLIRELLLRLEAHDGNVNSPPNLDDLGKSDLEISEHYIMLINEGFIEGLRQDVGSRTTVLPQRITWSGHDFIDSVRDPEIWRRTKEGALAAGGFTVELLKELAKGYVKKILSEKTGVPL